MSVVWTDSMGSTEGKYEERECMHRLVNIDKAMCQMILSSQLSICKRTFVATQYWIMEIWQRYICLSILSFMSHAERSLEILINAVVHCSITRKGIVAPC